MNNTINIDLLDANYNVVVGDKILSNLKKLLLENAVSESFYFIIDSFIYEKYKFELESCFKKGLFEFYILDAGKSNKTFNSAMKIFADLDQKNISRDVAIVAVGGGVIGDLAGFVASCWYRGVELIHFPTTLLSAVDSCLGGKTAINFRHTVNAVGTYHHPSSILIDSGVLLGLPDREISSGFGEIIKYAALGSNEILELLESSEGLTSEKISQFVSLSLKEKERFVRGDVKESSNRLFLNFGHTIGHAIEFSTIFNGKEMLRHGEGVALGMVAIFRICIILGYLQESDLDRLKILLERYGLPTYFASGKMAVSRYALIDTISDLAFKDKKRTKKDLRLIVLDGWGKPKIHITSDRNLIKSGVEEVVL